MKRIVAFVFLLLPILSSAQIRDVASITDTLPLYILDESMVRKDQIDISKIRSIEIIKGPEAAAIWGSKGANGVYIYTSEMYAKKKAEAMTLLKLVGRDPFYVVDGIPIANMDKLDPDSIINVEILKYSMVHVYSQRASKPIVIITTIKGEKLSYERKLGQLSPKYHSYIQRKNGNDNEVVYLVDGEQIKEPSKDYIVFLYDTINKKIKHLSVEMVKDIKTGLYTIPRVTITTKK